MPHRDVPTGPREAGESDLGVRFLVLRSELQIFRLFIPRLAFRTHLSDPLELELTEGELFRLPLLERSPVTVAEHGLTPGDGPVVVVVVGVVVVVFCHPFMPFSSRCSLFN